MASLDQDIAPLDAYGKGLSEDKEPRCWRCKKMLALQVTRPWVIICHRCKAKNGA
jgi:hypothetical protein